MAHVGHSKQGKHISKRQKKSRFVDLLLNSKRKTRSTQKRRPHTQTEKRDSTNRMMYEHKTVSCLVYVCVCIEAR